ncbi:S1 family peptidase [Thermococcus waiotapuensis]|uniref:S1 family peptidase n=1 Tax=Thermococcus waiotapuensis TaxID=90909 RepID=A0AAE4T386_9EURY|nr:S1 family peptidase [Thermococcus waiotapuensis]MDV3104812.1 S1 family peptidase [Thermococcus waiotapuensis]
MRLKLVSFLIVYLVVTSLLVATANAPDSNEKNLSIKSKPIDLSPDVCKPINYWIFKNGEWVQKSEPKVWWYCQEPEKTEKFEGFAFENGLLNESSNLHKATLELLNLVEPDELPETVSVKGLFDTKPFSYGGMFINEDRGLIFVYILKDDDKEIIKKAMEKYTGKINVVFLKGKYTLGDLEKWKKLALKLDLKQLGILGIDADEVHNTLTIELTDVTQDKLKALEKELEKIGIPKSAIRVEKRRMIQPASSPTDVFDPLIGGIGIRVGSGFSSTCTLGFTAKINNEDYFVTAAHCGEFGKTGDSVYQPWGFGAWNNVGVVVKNPPLKDENGYLVRESDAMLIKTSSRSIAPKVYGVESWKIEGTTTSVVGLYVCKYGMGSKKVSCGYVTKTDMIVHIKNTNILITDISEVSGMETAPGDSGAAVLVKPYYVPTTRIVGIVHGISADPDTGTTLTYFSEIDGILKELGNVEVAYGG